MRFSLAAASCVVLAALIAGCNASQGTSTLPSSGTGVGASHVSHGGGGDLAFKGGIPQFPKGHMSKIDMVKWMLSGKMLGFGTKKQMETALYAMEHAKPNRHVKYEGGKPAIWVGEPYEDDIQGVNKTGTTDVGSAISTTANGCYSGLGLKTDKKGNIWQACSETFNTGYVYTEPGVVQYKKTGAFATRYDGGCPTNIPASQCLYFYSDGVDVAATTSYVFASIYYYENVYYCGYSYCYNEGYGFYYWPRAGGQGTVINVGGAIPYWNIYEVSYMDADKQGNLWAYAYACESVYPYTCGTGIIKVANPTSGSPSVSNPVAFGSMPGQYYWGMVYVSDNGKILNVSDPSNATIYRWSLPSGSSMSSLGPNGCNPLLGGFSKGGKVGVWADVCYSDELDFIKASSNTGSTATNASLYYPQSADWAKTDKVGTGF